jgi:hypothetical protein
MLIPEETTEVHLQGGGSRGADAGYCPNTPSSLQVFEFTDFFRRITIVWLAVIIRYRLDSI